MGLHLIERSIYQLINHLSRVNVVIYEHSVSLHLFVSLNSLSMVLVFRVQALHIFCEIYIFHIVLVFCYIVYAEYIMRNAGLEEAQAGIKIARRNLSNLRYADDTLPGRA